MAGYRACQIGDSVAPGVYVSSVLSTFWRARTFLGNNWFLDAVRHPRHLRAFQRDWRLTPFVAMEYCGIGALVDPRERASELLSENLRTRKLLRTNWQFVGDRERFPDLV